MVNNLFIKFYLHIFFIYFCYMKEYIFSSCATIISMYFIINNNYIKNLFNFNKKQLQIQTSNNITKQQTSKDITKETSNKDNDDY